MIRLSSDNVLSQVSDADIRRAGERLSKPSGVILYDGPSQIDGAPIVAIATGLTRASRNAKTGAMIQTFILRADVGPVSALYNGADRSVCGDCPLAGDNGCYVNVGQSVGQVYDAYKRGSYDAYDHDIQAWLFARRPTRFGAYGDPVAVPYNVWSPLLRVTPGWTGYTHSWRIRRFWRYRHFLMASCETEADVRLAQSRGWRTFRTSLDVAPLPGEVLCPASDEAGKRVQCDKCKLCMGASKRAKSIYIPAHGSPATISQYRNTIGRLATS